MVTTTRLLALVPLLLVAAACGGDGDSTDGAANDSVAVDEPVDSAIDQPADTDAADATGSDEEAATPPSSGGGATLTLANGETFEFADVRCVLEPQVVVDQEILFNAVAYDDPGLSVNQFGDAGLLTGFASISVYDSNFENLWEADDLFGIETELTLEGSTIRGSGGFVPGSDPLGDPIQGEIVVNC